MRLIFRYLVLFGGVVLMINGCNGLISGAFGTHRLRNLSIQEIEQNDLGDADFVGISGGQLLEAHVSIEDVNWWGQNCVLQAYLTPAQFKALAAGDRASPAIIAYHLTSLPAAAPENVVAKSNREELQGLIGPPPADAIVLKQWSELNLDIPENVRYLHLGQEPMKWYYNICFFLGGLVMAAVPEALRFKKSGT